MHVKDLMSRSVVTIRQHASISEAITLMLSRRVSGLPVLDRHGHLCGILSEGDLLRRAELGTTPKDHWYSHFFEAGGGAAAYTAANSRRVGDLMSHPPITTEPDATLAEAVAKMAQHRIKRLPVLEKDHLAGIDRLVGILTRADLLRALAPLVAPAYEEPATSDADIAHAIADELSRQGWAASTGIQVAVKNGIVTLSGPIIAESQRVAARVLAENANGVRAVVDDLTTSDPYTLMPA